MRKIRDNRHEANKMPACFVPISQMATGSMPRATLTATLARCSCGTSAPAVVITADAPQWNVDGRHGINCLKWFRCVKNIEIATERQGNRESEFPAVLFSGC